MKVKVILSILFLLICVIGFHAEALTVVDKDVGPNPHKVDYDKHFPLMTGQGEWLNIEDEYFIIYYKERRLDDAEQILQYCNFARTVMIDVYPHELGFKVDVYLYDSTSWSSSPYTCWASVSSSDASMHFLTLSDLPEHARAWVDSLWYQSNVVHEYVHVVTYQDLHNTT